MNFINCGSTLTAELMQKTVVFWSRNSAQHVQSLLRQTMGTTAVLKPDFKERLKRYNEAFLNVAQNLSSRKPSGGNYQEFLRLNTGFVSLLERIKFEAFSGYPILQQSVFHYIYEGRYINAVFGAKNLNANLLITTYFIPFLNNSVGCVYNQVYFWSIIGGMHPSLIMENNSFYGAINGYAKEFLTDICNRFNNICYMLTSTKKPIKKVAMIPIFEEFCALNRDYLEFLSAIKQTSPKIFTLPSSVRLPATFFEAVDHQISEHRLVLEINENMGKILGV